MFKGLFQLECGLFANARKCELIDKIDKPYAVINKQRGAKEMQISAPRALCCENASIATRREHNISTSENSAEGGGNWGERGVVHVHFAVMRYGPVEKTHTRHTRIDTHAICYSLWSLAAMSSHSIIHKRIPLVWHPALYIFTPNTCIVNCCLGKCISIKLFYSIMSFFVQK